MVGQVVQAGNMPFLVNVCDYGANGNRDTADPTANTMAIQKAFNAALLAPNAYSATVYFPPGQYLVNGPITLNSGVLEGGLTIMGSGRRSSFLLWTTDTPILQFDCTATTMSSVTITDMGFFCQFPAKQNDGSIVYPKTSYAIAIYGNSPYGFERALFESLGFYGPMTAAITSYQTDHASGYAAFAVRWTTFNDIDFDTGGQPAPPNRCVWFQNASGTGNILSNFTGGGTASIIESGGDSFNSVCGDMLIQGIQGGNGADMIKLTGGSYMERVSILNCQADGNVKNGLNLVGMGQFEVRNFLWGGATTWNLQNCYDYVIDGMPGTGGQCMQSSIHRGYKWNDQWGNIVYSEEHDTYTGTTGGSLFSVSFPGSTGYRGNTITNAGSSFAVMIEIHANGTISLPSNGGTVPLVCKFTGVLSLNGRTASFFNSAYDGVPGLAFSVDTSSTTPVISVAAMNGYGISGALGARIRSIGSPHWVTRL